MKITYAYLKSNNVYIYYDLVSRYYAIIRQMQYGGYYFAYKQSAWLKPGTLTLIIKMYTPRAGLFRVVFSTQTFNASIVVRLQHF